MTSSRASSTGFPRLYAAASLKQQRIQVVSSCRLVGFSAALCRGLIEAWLALYVTAFMRRRVFRGFMPRPH